jgi:hypothetical protein
MRRIFDRNRQWLNTSTSTQQEIRDNSYPISEQEIRRPRAFNRTTNQAAQETKPGEIQKVPKPNKQTMKTPSASKSKAETLSG